MAPVVIANPILNSPFEEPTRHFRFSDDGITDEIVTERRIAGYFVPVPQPRKKGKQLALDTEWTQESSRDRRTRASPTRSSSSEPGDEGMSHYHINVFWSAEDECWVADVPDLQTCCAFGDTPAEAIAEVQVAMEGWIETARAHGLEIPEARYRPTPALATR